MYGNDESSEVGPRGTFETYRAEGEQLYKNGEYRKAIESFTTALEIRKEDQSCLVARSRCYLQLGDTDNALKDAETSLADDTTFHKGLYQKAEALYCKGEFELALVFYHRGHKLRPELQEFRLGIQKAQEAIDNSVGSPDKVKLTKEGDLSFFYKKDEVKKTKSKTYGTRSASRRKQKQQPVAPPQNDKTVKQMLGELYGDKMYLEKLMKEIDPNTDAGHSIFHLVNEGLTYLDTRTDFWRQQKPMYARRRDMVGGKGTLVPESKITQHLIGELEKIDEEQSEGLFEESLQRAKKALALIKKYPNNADGPIVNRNSIVTNLFSLMGNAYLEMDMYKEALIYHQKDYNCVVKWEVGDEAKSRALDNLGRIHARIGNFQDAIDCWTTKIPFCATPLESTWLHHEIGRCHLELGNNSEAKQHGQKSSQAAEEAADDMWRLNAMVLVAQSEVKLGENSEALTWFENALTMAKAQGDPASEKAIRKAIDDCHIRIAQEVKAVQEKEDNEVNKEGNEEERGTEDTNPTQEAEVTEQTNSEVPNSEVPDSTTEVPHSDVPESMAEADENSTV